jgi:hypothetical protein
LSSIFAAQQGATAKRKNTVVGKKAFKIIAKANPDSQPIVFENMTVKIFVSFLSSRARAKDAFFLARVDLEGIVQRTRSFTNSVR